MASTGTAANRAAGCTGSQESVRIETWVDMVKWWNEAALHRLPGVGED